MKIIIAPNAFKGSLSATGVADSIEKGIYRVYPLADVVKLPIADGGDGTLELIIDATGGQTLDVEVLDPLGRKMTSHFGILPDDETAIIEMACASGVRLLARGQLNPMKTTTYGTGQLIAAALDHGCQKIIIGVGGSATVDGGIGMAQALGVKLLDEQGESIGYGGEGLSQLASIDISELDPRIKDTEITVACDVENPLLGEEGAAPIFGPQKGATPEMVEQLAEYLANYAEIIERDLDKDVTNSPWMGAAGGLTAGLVAFLDSKIEFGADVLLNIMQIEDHLKGADLLITGEGQLDGQTIYGKGPSAIAKRAKRFDIPVIALAGCLADDVDVVYEHGIDALMSIVKCPMSLDDAMEHAEELIASAAERTMRLIRIGRQLQTVG